MGHFYVTDGSPMNEYHAKIMNNSFTKLAESAIFLKSKINVESHLSIISFLLSGTRTMSRFL